MKEFSNFDAFSKHIDLMVNNYNEREFKALNFLGEVLEEEAKDKIGWLQTGAGPFENWPELADSTKQDKERKGLVFNEDYNPLFRTGELKDSIHHVVNKFNHELYVGSDSDIALYQELGTKNIPPRSFLGLTFFKEKAEIEFILGLFLLYWIMQERKTLKRLIHGSI